MSAHDVFISYVRAREELVHELREHLEAGGLRAWVDVVGIGPGERWRAAIVEAIVETHTFVIVLDEGWLGSQVCRDELALAVEHGKTLVAMIPDHDPASWKAAALAVPDELAARNYVWGSQRSMAEVAGEVLQTARTDYDWKRLSSRLERRALAWRESEETIGLLRGRELARFRATIDAAAGKDPPLTELQRAFLAASQRAEATALEQERLRARRAQSGLLAARARQELLERPALGLALAKRAWEVSGTLDALQAFGAWFTAHPRLVWMTPRMRFEVRALAFNGKGYLAVGEALDALVEEGRGPSLQLRAWNVDSRDDDGSLSERPPGFRSATWCGGERLALISAQTIVGYRLDTSARRLRQLLSGYGLPSPRQVEASPSGMLLAIALGSAGLAVQRVGSRVAYAPGQTTVQWRDVGPPRPIEGVETCERLAWLDDHRLLLVRDGGLWRLDLSGAEPPRELISPDESTIVDVDAHDGRWIALATTGTPILWMPTEDGSLRTIELVEPTNPARARLLPRRDQIPDRALVGGGGGHSGESGCVMVELDSGRVSQTLLAGHEVAISSLAVDPRGTNFAAGRKDGSTLVWSTEQTSLSLPDPRTHEPAPRPRLVQRLRERDLFELELELELPDEPSSLTLTLRPPAGGLLPGMEVPVDLSRDLVGVGWDTKLVWFQRAAGTRLREGLGHTNPIRGVVVSPLNGLWASLATSFRYNSWNEVMIWDPRSSRPIVRLDMPLAIDALAFDASGQTLLLLAGDTPVHALEVDPDAWRLRAHRMTWRAVEDERLDRLTRVGELETEGTAETSG